MVPCSAGAPLALLFHLVRTLPTCLSFTALVLMELLQVWAKLDQWTTDQSVPAALAAAAKLFRLGFCLPCRTPGRLGFVQRFPPGGVGMCVEETAPFRANAWDSSGGQSCPRRRPKHFAAGRKRQSAPPTGPPSLAVVKRSALVPCDRGRAESPSELCDQPLLEVLKWRSEPTVARRWHCPGVWIARHLGRNVRWPASRLQYAGVTASAVSRCSGLLPRASSGDAL